mmetsp:Transcript_739/g.3049  ORF Transcript_739/g.3049 Transcript_739/m.3049 type:complete len:204 (-) Transcript_739:771-1382(-)
MQKLRRGALARGVEVGVVESRHARRGVRGARVERANEILARGLARQRGVRADGRKSGARVGPGAGRARRRQHPALRRHPPPTPPPLFRSKEFDPTARVQPEPRPRARARRRGRTNRGAHAPEGGDRRAVVVRRARRGAPRADARVVAHPRRRSSARGGSSNARPSGVRVGRGRSRGGRHRDRAREAGRDPGGGGRGESPRGGR